METLTAEQVRIERGPRSGQLIMIGIDSTRLGPALGGCRIKPYARWHEGLDDVLRLSAAMTRKAALAGLDHGGGKTVVALDGSAFDRDDLLADIAGLIEDLDGGYITGPDIGTGPADMGVLHRHTPHVLCRPEEEGGSGDSSGPTALGVRSSIEAVCEHLWPGRDLADLRFTLIGLGHVGARVGGWLAGRGARLTVTDIDSGRKTLAGQWNATWTTPERALSAEANVLVPCATGGLLTAATTSSVAAGAVVGAANNQLDHDDTAQLLHARGVLWAPDTVVSGGGIIAAVARELRGASAQEAEREVLGIGPRLATILDDAWARGITPLRASQGLVDLRLRTGR